MAQQIRDRLHGCAPVAETTAPDGLQDPYSLRCSPHVLGVLADGLDWIVDWVEVEANGASDNPLLDPDTGQVLMGGNFYGGHIAFAMDALKTALASAADLCDRQLALLVDTRFNRGLPAGLVQSDPESGRVHHGFKAMQITASALTAEALQLCTPAAIFSRSTESHNQDKVSMGTIAARNAAQICELTAHVVGAQLLAAAQACELRGGLQARPRLASIVESIRSYAAPLETDRPMDAELARIADAIMMGELEAGHEAA